MNKTMKKYPKAFEQWWRRSANYLGRDAYRIRGLEDCVKRIAFNAWLKGRSYQKAYHDFPYN